MSTLQTNMNALRAANALAKNQVEMTHTMESLSTGSRLNRSSDDAAGISIKETMTAQINGLNAAVRNSNDAVSLLQTADAAMGEQSSLLQRMRELSVYAVNDTYSSAQKSALNSEFTALASQFDSIKDNTQWNGIGILSGSGTALNFQVGAAAGTTLSVAIASQSLNVYGLSGVSIATAADASAAMSLVDLAIISLATSRSTVGAAVNRLTYAIDNLTNISQNTMESKSKVSDTDYAKATSDLARQQIIQQAGTAMLAQANQMQSMVLALLK